MKEKTAATNFSKINSPQDLIAYLSNSGKRLTPTKNNGTQYVYHYTKLSNVVSIINSRSWWLNSPQAMNDGLEFRNSTLCSLRVSCTIQAKVSLCGQCMLNHGKMAC